MGQCQEKRLVNMIAVVADKLELDLIGEYSKLKAQLDPSHGMAWFKGGLWASIKRTDLAI